MPPLKHLLTLPLFLTFSLATSADTIFLKNGDRITGVITTMQEHELQLKSAYSDIKIPWSDINNIDSDQAVTVQLSDDSVIKGVLSQTSEGLTLQSQSLNTPVSVSLKNIKAINPPIISDDAIITGGVNLGGSKSSGNTDNQSFHADAKIIARAGNNKYSAGAIYNQAANDSKESENNFHIYSQYDHYFLPNWYASLFTNFTKDRFQDLNFRSAFGAGVGHELWNTKKSFLSAELGVAYTIEDYNEGEDREFIAGRWAINYHNWFLDNRLQFFHNHEGIISMEDVSDVLVRSHTGFKVPIYQGINLLAQFDWDYDNKPAEGKKNTDTRYIFGVGYNW